VLWVLRDCCSGEVLLARSLLGATENDLVPLLEEVATLCRQLAIPIGGVITDGQHSIRKAVARALPGVAHQLCHFHYLREAAKPISDTDRHAKKELKKRVRGVRPLERELEGRNDEEAKVVRAYCQAVRSSLTVTTSYWTGLFHCYQVTDLPRTNNDLEQFFGQARHVERRATGRKRASPALVIRGSVRVVAAGASRLVSYSAADLRLTDVAAWSALRQTLDYRHEGRRCQLRFRRDPQAYLASLEQQLFRSSLPT
jgi:Transposase, Mutator family